MTLDDIGPPEPGAFPALRWEQGSGETHRYLEAYADAECIGCVYAERWDGVFPWRMEAGCGPDGRADTVDEAKAALEREWRAWCARTGLVHVAALPEPGANPLDTPEVQDLIAASFDHPGLYMGGPSLRARAMAERMIRDLAPHVAAAQHAAWQACVEAAGEACDELAAANDALALSEPIAAVSGQFADAAEVARACAEAVRQVPTPAAFAAPEAAS